MLRFLAFDFLARMWLPNARSRMSLPEPLILIRLAVPLCVLSLGINIPLGLELVLVRVEFLTLAACQWWHKVRTGNRGSRKLLLPNSNREVASAELRLAFDNGVVSEKV